MRQAETVYSSASNSGDAHEELVMQELSTVYYIARRIHERLPHNVELEDLVGAGVVGLLEASRTFDITKRAQFRTFAKFRIRGSIIDSLRDADWASRSLRKRGREIAAATDALTAKLQRPPSVAEIADHLSLDIEQLQKIMSDLNGAVLAGQEPSMNASSMTYGDVIESAASINDPDPFDLCFQGEIKSQLAAAIASLPERQQLIVSLYYREELTLKEIAEIIGVAVSRVSQIRKAAVDRLREIIVQQSRSRTLQSLGATQYVGE